VEHARIEKKRKRLEANIAGLGSANAEGGQKQPVEQGTRSAKGRSLEVVMSGLYFEGSEISRS
jgi:hypothetical protein